MRVNSVLFVYSILEKVIPEQALQVKSLPLNINAMKFLVDLDEQCILFDCITKTTQRGRPPNRTQTLQIPFPSSMNDILNNILIERICKQHLKCRILPRINAFCFMGRWDTLIRVKVD